MPQIIFRRPSLQTRPSTESYHPKSDPLHNSSRASLPTPLPASDIALEDNVLVSEFPKLQACGAMVHSKAMTRIDTAPPDSIALGISCCAVCAGQPQERFRCKRCHSIVYCSSSCQCADRGFHNVVCEALQVVHQDMENPVARSEILDFIRKMGRCTLPVRPIEELEDVALEEVIHDHVVDPVQCSIWQCLHFVHGTPMGRQLTDYLTYPLTLWKYWSTLQSKKGACVHIIGAARGECEFPSLWYSLLPYSDFVSPTHLVFVGPHVPKSLDRQHVYGSLHYYRGLYHTTLSEVEETWKFPTFAFAPSMGLTTGLYDWTDSLTALEQNPRLSYLLTTCGTLEEMSAEIKLLREQWGWEVVDGPQLNSFASTFILQNNNMANDVFRKNCVMCLFRRKNLVSIPSQRKRARSKNE